MLARYTQGSGIDEPLAEVRSGTISYYDQDWLGSVTSLSSSTGSLANTYVYDASGNLTASTGSVVNPFQYTGRDYDPETGLRYYRARYLDSAAGRFLSEDPVGFAGGDAFYGYSENNPASLLDPFGLQSDPGYGSKPWSTYLSSAWSTLSDLTGWVLGGKGRRDHWNDGTTTSLERSPAWDDIVNQVKKNHCTGGRYCGQFTFRQVFHPHNLDLTIQAVGSFWADISFNGNTMVVNAFNEWGLQSLTRIPGTNYRSPTLQDMIFNGARKGMPSSMFDNTHNGPMHVERFYYHWTQKSPCCEN